MIPRDPATFETHSRGESLALEVDVLAGMASSLAATVILVILLFRIYRDGRSSWDAFRASLIALFLGEVIMGIGHAMSLKWVIEGNTYTGGFCTAQGLMRQLGNTYVALSTIVIAVQTFTTVWWLQYLNRTISVIVNCVTFVFVILWVGIGFGIHTNPPEEYYAVPTPYWCWIGEDFFGERLGGEYIWYWIALFGSILLYIPLFLLAFDLIRTGTEWYRPRAEIPRLRRARYDGPNQNVEAPHRNRRLWSTILYPILYCILVLPLSIVRWLDFGGASTKAAATLTVVAIFGLSGALNAMLYAFTRTRFFQPVGEREPHAAATAMAPLAGEENQRSKFSSEVG